MDAPLLTIVTITSNDNENLSRTLRSLRPLLEMDLAWEHLIVDGSPGVTREVLDGLRATWPIRTLQDPAKGIFTAQNMGVAGARGELVWLLNAGDCLADAGVLGKVLGRFVADPGIDLICSGAARTEDGEVVYPTIPRISFRFSTLGGAPSANHMAMIYRRRVFEIVGDYDPQITVAADYAHHLRCIAAGLRTEIHQAVLTHYERGGFSEQNFMEGHRQLRNIHRAMRERFSWSEAALHDLFRSYYLVRLRLIRQIQRSPALRPLRDGYARLRRLTAPGAG